MSEDVPRADETTPGALMDLQKQVLAALEPNVRDGVFAPVERLD
jgi:hypothetical protein